MYLIVSTIKICNFSCIENVTNMFVYAISYSTKKKGNWNWPKLETTCQT